MTRFFRMNRRKFINTIFILAFFCIVFVFSIFQKCTAARKAQLYLDDKYNQEMECTDVRFSWLDPSLYHVYFVSSEPWAIPFEVLVQSDMTIRTNIYGSSADNYCIKRFESIMTDYLYDTLEDYLENHVEISTIAHTSGLYAFVTDEPLTEAMTIQELGYAIGSYRIEVLFSNPDASLQEVSTVLLNIIETFRQNDFSPENIVVKGQMLPENKKNIEFKNIEMLTNASQIERLLME